MSAVSVNRLGEVQAVLDRVRSWARRHEDVRAAALVGSWARGQAEMESDVDVVLLTDSPAQERADLPQALGASQVVLTRADGALTETRLATPTGLEVELGVADLSWADTGPVDAGTARVAQDGLIPLHDPDDLLAGLLAAVDQRA